MRRFRTELVFTLSDSGEEHREPMLIHYSVNRAHRPTLTDPGCGPSININAATVAGDDAPGWLYRAMENDEALEAELLQDAAEADEYARDQAADARREEARLS